MHGKKKKKNKIPGTRLDQMFGFTANKLQLLRKISKMNKRWENTYRSDETTFRGDKSC